MMIMRILLLGFADVAHDRDDDDHGYDASGQGTKTILYRENCCKLLMIKMMKRRRGMV